MNVRTLVPALAVTCAALLAGCSGRDNEAPSPTAPLPPATSTAERTPSSPTPTAVTQVRTYPNPQATGTFVYIVMVGVDRTTERFYPKLEVIAQDLRSGRITARIPFGGAGEYPLAASIAGERIIVATESRIVRFARDGSSELTLFRTSDRLQFRTWLFHRTGPLPRWRWRARSRTVPVGPPLRSFVWTAALFSRA